MNTNKYKLSHIKLFHKMTHLTTEATIRMTLWYFVYLFFQKSYLLDE